MTSVFFLFVFLEDLMQTCNLSLKIYFLQASAFVLPAKKKALN